MKSNGPIVRTALLLLLVASATAFYDQPALYFMCQAEEEPWIKCDVQDDCMGKNAVCQDGKCSCSYGFVMTEGDCFLEEEYIDVEEELFRERRSPDSKVEKLQKKLVKAQIKEAKKHGAVVVPVAHVPVAHVPVAHVPVAHVPVAHVPVVHVSRHRRTPGAVSKLERKIVKAQVKRVAKKETKKVLTSRHKRDSHQKKIAKLERKLVKEQIKQAKKDAKKGRVSHIPVGHAARYVSYHPQPVAYHPHPIGFIKG